MSTTAALENDAGQLALRAAARATGLMAGRDRFLFLRHGRTAGNLNRIFQHPDTPLCAEGFDDANAAANGLSDVAFDRIYASDMARAWLTAGRVAAVTGKPVAVRRALRERYFGDFIGTSSAGMDWRLNPPNGEPMLEFVERTVRGVAELLVPGPLPLLVSHGGVLRVLCGALDIELSVELTANALPLEFERNANAWRVTALMAPVVQAEMGIA
ncbi:MAG: histidine phosphatase family protein [Gammaproteobacteria bacterium]|nr:histidine phosphatase family protein [Gammaproteobacteria bacterium]